MGLPTRIKRRQRDPSFNSPAHAFQACIRLFDPRHRGNAGARRRRGQRVRHRHRQSRLRGPLRQHHPGQLRDAIAKRIDLLSEFDLVYKKRYGLRVSGAAWYDWAYGETSKSNPNAPLVGIPSYVGNQYSSTVRRLYQHGAEFLDAFVFGGVDLGEVPVQAKLGRHTIY
jgi:hypothetical protein